MTDISSQNWAVRPGIGIGHLKFGQTRADVDAFASIYGPVTRVLDGASSATVGISDDEFDHFLAELGLSDLISDEEKAAASALDQSLHDQSANMIDERRMGQFFLALEYVDGALFSLSTDALNSKITIEDMPVFSTDPATLLQRLQLLNGGAAVSGPNLLLDRLGLLISGLCVHNDNGTLRFCREDADSFGERAITVFAPQELSRYWSDSFKPVNF